MMSKIITAVMLALAIAALAGCGSIGQKASPSTNVQVPQPTTKPVVAPEKLESSAASETSPTDMNQFNPGVLSAEQKAQNLKKCQGWKKLLATEKKKKDFFCWQHVGADPYQGRAETALAQSGWPAEVQQLFLDQIRQDNKAEMVLERGMVFDWSTFGKGVSKAFVHRNVVADWKEGEVHRASVFTVSHGGKVYKLYFPWDCGNWSGNVYSIPLPVVIGACPDGWSLTANAWSLRTIKTISSDLGEKVETMIAVAKARESMNATRFESYQTDALSRTFGKRLREEVKTRAPVTADIAIRYVDVDPQTKKVSSVRDIGVLHVVYGVGTFRFSDDPRQHVVRTVWPTSSLSPTVSGGEPLLQIFGYEWTSCGLHMSGVVP